MSLLALLVLTIAMLLATMGGLDTWIVELGLPPGPLISYITPDAGAPGMCVAVEIIGPADNQGNFGDDQIYNTNAVVQLSRPSDSVLVRLGPSVVSWNGRAIQQMFLIEPHAGQIDTEVYFTVTWNGVTSTVDSFQIVTPAHVGALTGGGMLPTSGRTVRNTMVIDSLILTNGTFTCPQTDPDPNTPGNQAYLPLRILSKGHIELLNATLSANGYNGTTASSGGNGGPGGGGGGAGYPGAGGAGYTGGGGDDDNATGPGGVGTGSTNGSNNWQGGMSLDSVTGGTGEQHTSGGGDDGGGGGTGHPFGTSGQNGNASSSPAGGYGAGSAGGSTSNYLTNYGGGGGGNETSGTQGQGTGNNGGNVVGNPMVVPLFGGSGGGAGNQTYISFLGSSSGGSGGGGGGAIELTSFAKLEVLTSTISVQGGNGSNAKPEESAAGGGGGSGGAITIDARDSISIDRTSTFNVTGGSGGTSSDANENGGNGGVGRIRINGFASKYASDTTKKYFLPQNGFAGPSIERITFTTDSFYVHAHAEYWDSTPIIPVQIEIYWMWPSTGIWQSASATFIPDNGSHTAGWIYGNVLSPNLADTQLYAVAVQLASPLSDPHVDVPGYVMSHTSGIIVKVTGPPKDSLQPTAINFGDVLVGKCSDDTTIEIYSIGKSALTVSSATLSGAYPSQYKIITPLPVSLPPGDSLALTLQFCPDSNKCGLNVTLSVSMSDTTKIVALTGCGVQPEMIIQPLVLDFGRVHVGDCKDSFVVVTNTGKDPLTITSELIQDPHFTVLDNLPIVVPAGGSAQIDLRFCPSDTTVRIAADSIIGDAPQSPVVLIMEGNGKVGILSMPSVIDFGDVRKGTCKDSIFYAKNVGNDTLIIENDPITASGFTAIAPVLPIVLQPDSSIAFNVQFCSTDTGSFEATMTAGTSDLSTDTVLLLAHTGFGILSISDTIDFGSVAIGGCKDTNVQVKNVGTDTLVLTPDASFKPPFSYVGSSPFAIAPGQVVTITLQFCPQDTNEAIESTLFDTIGDGESPIFILMGKGIEGALTTSGPIDLGCVLQGTSVTQTVPFTNGEAALQNFAAAITPVGAAQIVVQPPTSLAAGQMDSVVLIIPATTLGTFSATLTFSWTNDSTPVTVPITAEVTTPPAIIALDTFIQFPATLIGDSSIINECIQITNYSCIPVPLSSILISGSLASEFEIDSSTASTSIADSATATICLRFKPTRSGYSTATLVAVSGGDTISLTDLSGFGEGQGVAVELAIDTVSGRPGQIVNVPIRTLNDVTAASIDTVMFRVSFNPMQLDLKAPIASTGSSSPNADAGTYTVNSFSIGDKEITASFPMPLTGAPIIAELPFEILQPTANTAVVQLTSASFGNSLATLSTTSDGLIEIEQCDTNDRVAIAPSRSMWRRIIRIRLANVRR